MNVLASFADVMWFRNMLLRIHQRKAGCFNLFNIRDALTSFHEWGLHQVHI